MNHNMLLISLIVFLAIFFSRYLAPIFKICIRKISTFFPKEIHQEILNQTKTPYSLLVLSLTCYIGFNFISIEERWDTLLYHPLKVTLTYSLLLFIWQFLDIFEKLIALNLKKNAENIKESTITKVLLPYFKRVLKVFSFFVCLLFLLQNFGFNVTSLLASLGIGGVAVALAAKETLSNFFGGFSVIVDKPFSVGDWIICKDVEGTVEDIGFRSTKVKTFYDSLVTIPNAIISDSFVDNLGKRQSRRSRFTLGITYDSSPEKIEAFVEGIKNIIEANPYTRKDYYQCYFSGYGAYSLDIFVNFFLKVSDWDSELLQKQNIFLEILRLAQELEVAFAFPTQTLDVVNLPGHEKLEKTPLSIEKLQEKSSAFKTDGALSRPQGLGLYKPKN